MAPRYEVRLRDTAGAYVAVLTNWQRLEYTRRIDAPDNHALLFDARLGPVAAFVLDAQVEVWRADLALVPPLANSLDYEGFHRTPVAQTTGDNAQLFTSYGQGYEDLLARRAILYPTGSMQAAKTGPGETVLKAYVEENAGPGATDPPRLLDGVTLGFSIEADGGAGSAWTGSREWRNLLETCQEISKATLVDFGVVGIGAALFELQAKAFPWGVDRSVTGLDPATGLNATGNAPVIFALGFGNMGEPVYSQNRTNEVNVVVALGQGLEADRETAIATDATAIAASPWNQSEVTRNANTEDTTAGLTAAADGYLADLQMRESFSFRILQSTATVYGRDYACGDIVTARYNVGSTAFEANYQIVSVTIVVEKGSETINVEVQNVSA